MRLIKESECKGTLENWEDEDLPKILDKYKSLEHYNDC